MVEVPTPQQDRRQAPRTRLVEIAYLGMGPENGGLVLDVSDGGLSFHSVAPVQPNETINFLLSLRGHSRIEGSGVVVWTSKMNTVCGMKFTSLSDGAREHLNDWTSQSRIPDPEAALPTGALEAPALPAAHRTESHVGGPNAASSFPAPVDFIAPVMFTVPEETALWQKPLFVWTMFIILGFALSVAAFFYGIRVGRGQTGAPASSAPGVVASSEGRSIAAPSASPALPVPADDALPAPGETNSVPPIVNDTASKPGGTLMNTSKTEEASAINGRTQDVEGSPILSREQRTEQVENGEAELAAAQAFLRGDNGPRDSAKAARLLWSAVGKGNSTAEVLLADLYLLGDGVVKSCEQGRVLLNAASRSGNTEAQEKLDQLNANGCQ